MMVKQDNKKIEIEIDDPDPIEEVPGEQAPVE